MKKLIMLKGLPASGKTKFAMELVATGYKRVSKDDLRAMIDFSKWSYEREEFIKGTECSIAEAFLNVGYNVVVDDTNFIYEDFWKIIAEKCGAEFEVKFFDVHPTECVLRDASRGDRSVGAKVIWGMYNRYLKPKLVPYNKELPDAYIFDLDGTIAEMKDRSPYEWNRVGEDTVNEHVCNVLDALAKSTNIIIVSGRDEVCRQETIDWLAENDIKPELVLMRKKDDNRKDSIVKKEIYEENIKGKYNILGIFDDREQVVSMWRDLGLTCFQCDWGRF